MRAFCNLTLTLNFNVRVVCCLTPSVRNCSAGETGVPEWAGVPVRNYGFGAPDREPLVRARGEPTAVLHPGVEEEHREDGEDQDFHCAADIRPGKEINLHKEEEGPHEEGNGVVYSLLL